ncbi:DUF5004 domain-containing protein [Hymenobacter sp. BT491]|uniref:DUF5004 domain-containing protein n=1 Tax=Hymenobacter sp. BT491 TaxID=2766779 RepID=UPI0016538AF3|nr:DUF5004 domain-containing protein [Hymenobacter sp. BT491]MBC6989518.1 DUF5004 domain-containing protein [Hymenobacter sp. BT491]
MKKLPLFLSLAALFSLAACEKETVELKDPGQQSATANAVQTKSNTLASGSWRLTAMTAASAAEAGKGVVTTDLFFLVKPWLRDNQIQYNADGSYLLDEGTLKATPADPQQLPGTWKLNATGDSLTVTLKGSVRRFGVAELTPTVLRLTQTNAAAEGQASTITSVFMR